MVIANYTTTREQKEKTEGNLTEGYFFSESSGLRHSGILYLKVDYRLRDKLKEELEYYIKGKTAPNMELLVAQKKVKKDFGFHLALKNVWYPDKDRVFSDLLVLELVPNISEENYGAFYTSVRTLEGVYGIIGTKVPVYKGTLTAKSRYHTLPTYIAQGEFGSKVVLNRQLPNLKSGTYVYIPSYNSIGEVMYFDKGYYNVSVGKKILTFNLNEFHVIGCRYDIVNLTSKTGNIIPVTITEILGNFIFCSKESGKSLKISVNNFINWRLNE
jgi:hypothetical protein